MGRTVGELLDSLDGDELIAWEEFYKLEPFGPVQDDYRAGLLVSLVHSALRGRNEPYRAPDFFFPSIKTPTRPQTPDDIRAAAKRWADQANAARKV